MYNKVILIGNVVKDVETKSLQKAKVSKFRVAANDPYKKDATVFIDCEAWDDQAEFAEKWLKKGKGIIIDGRLCMDSWEKDGRKETKLYIKAQEIRFSNVSNKENSSEETSPAKKVSAKKTVEDEDTSEVPF